MSRCILNIRILLLFFVIIPLSVPTIRAQGVDSTGEHLTIKLVTISPGDDLTMWWGHTALIVEDTRTRRGRFYNYGLFSFQQENFFLNFARGRLIFWVGVSNASRALWYYRSLNRSIVIHTLNLPPDKRREMADFLAWNVQPDNAEYLYDHFYDNCATRVRDLIDRMIGGQLHDATQNPAPFTLRGYTRHYTQRGFFMDWLLMFLMNDTIDKPISEWDAMFLPDELERFILRTEYTDSTGNRLPLVKETRIWFEAQNPTILKEGAPAHWPYGLLLGLLLATVTWFITANRHQRRLLFGLWVSVYGFIIGLPGSILLFMATLTDHTVTYYNENLLLANPLTFALFIFAIGYLRHGRRSTRWFPWLIYLQSLMTLSALLLKVLPEFDQFNWLTISILLPPNLTLGLALFFSRKKQN